MREDPRFAPAPLGGEPTGFVLLGTPSILCGTGPEEALDVWASYPATCLARGLASRLGRSSDCTPALLWASNMTRSRARHPGERVGPLCFGS